MTPSETYSRILQIARRLFVQQGYTATSMRQVAGEAGIGKATIYHHFPDKQAVVMALLQEDIGHMKEVLQLVQAQDEPRQRIQVAATASINFLFEFVEIMQIVRREVPGGRDQLQAEFAGLFQEYIALLAEAIRRGMEQGIFRTVEPTDAARVLIAMIQGTFAMAYLGNRPSQPPKKVAAALLDVYFQGIDAR
jgi:AcrR family transcriptional regulator